MFDWWNALIGPMNLATGFEHNMHYLITHLKHNTTKTTKKTLK